MSYFAFVAFALVALLVPGCSRALVAGLMRVRVPRLVIGFGPIVTTLHVGRTRVQVHALPIGAFSQIAGLSAVDEPIALDAADAFPNRPALARLAVLFAGTLGYAACALAIAVASSLVWGVPRTGSAAIVDAVRDGTPAARAGLARGDEILALDDVPIKSVSDVAPLVGRSQGAIRLLVSRDDHTLTLTVTPVAEAGTRRLGIQLTTDTRFERVTPDRAIAAGAALPWRAAVFLLEGTIASARRHGLELGTVTTLARKVHRPREALPYAALVMMQLCVWLALALLLHPVSPYDTGRALARLWRRRPRDLPPARALGDVAAARPSFARLDFVMLAVFALSALLVVPKSFLMCFVGIGLGLRWPLAWSFAAAVAPAFALFGFEAAAFGERRSLGVAVLFACGWLLVALWLRSRGLRARFGLTCPHCRHVEGRAVLGSARVMSCLACGSTWRRPPG